MEIKSHKDLKVWQEAMNLVVDIYSLTSLFPNSEQYGLSTQMRRCSVSIPSNIAEGAGRRGSKELCKFLYISQGSLAELETQIEIASRLGYISEKSEIREKIIYIRRMLTKLIKSLESNQ
ncbi:MAG: four helix bundle protein [Sediminicola sp.]